ncbi:hypothetical protein HAX54_029812, partial [Datura stramonium]|nr:hypothetical protein [Datura stramonium]
MKYNERCSPVNHLLGPVKRQMNCRLGYKASSHFPRLALHRCSASQERKNTSVALNEQCFFHFSVNDRWLTG